MKKLTACLLISISLLAFNQAMGQAFSFSVQNTVCYSSTAALSNTSSAFVTSPYSGATSYSWACSSGTASGIVNPLSGSSGSNAVVSFTSCGIYTLTCIPYNSGSPLVGSISSTVNVVCPNWLTTAMPTASACPGNYFPLKASGGVSYTWTAPYGPFGVPIVISNTASAYVIPLYPNPTINSFTVNAISASGCTAQALSFITLAPTGVSTVSVSAGSVNCAGSSFTLTGSGANSYTWIPGNINTSSIVVSPISNTCYTLTGLTTGCIGATVSCASVTPLPTLQVTSAGTVCAGNSIQLTATGANTYTWSNGVTGASIIVTPTTATCYSVMGTGPGGCNSALPGIGCINVLTAPVTISPASQTVCEGSSASFTASGAGTYTWSNSSNASTINVLPLTSSNYTVSGTAANGCYGLNVASVFVDTTCANVWPGDANSDGLVDNTDVFEIGFAFGNTGAARSPGGNAYISQYASSWAGTVSSGKNKAHADCNGDGTIDNGDTVAIYNNYALTHAFKNSSSASVNDLSLVPDQMLVAQGSWHKADIVLGDAASPLSQLYGVAFDIDFDQSQVEANSAYIIYTASFLNAGNQNVNFRKKVFNSGKIYAASVREDGVNVSGSGKIGEFWFRIKPDAMENAAINISISSAKKTNKAGVLMQLTGGSALVTVGSEATGLNESALLNNAVSLYPNPASGLLTLQSSRNDEIKYALLDVTGREVLRGSFSTLKNIDLTAYAAGTYIMSLKAGRETLYKKLVIEK